MASIERTLEDLSNAMKLRYRDPPGSKNGGIEVDRLYVANVHGIFLDTVDILLDPETNPKYVLAEDLIVLLDIMGKNPLDRQYFIVEKRGVLSATSKVTAFCLLYLTSATGEDHQKAKEHTEEILKKMIKHFPIEDRNSPHGNEINTYIKDVFMGFPVGINMACTKLAEDMDEGKLIEDFTFVCQTFWEAFDTIPYCTLSADPPAVFRNKYNPDTGAKELELAEIGSMIAVSLTREDSHYPWLPVKSFMDGWVGYMATKNTGIDEESLLYEGLHYLFNVRLYADKVALAEKLLFDANYGRSSQPIELLSNQSTQESKGTQFSI